MSTTNTLQILTKHIKIKIMQLLYEMGQIKYV